MKKQNAYAIANTANACSLENGTLNTQCTKSAARFSEYTLATMLVILAVFAAIISTMAFSAETALAVPDSEFALKVGEIELTIQHGNKTNNGIVLVGSSSFGRWASADTDIASVNGKLKASQISNFGIGGSKSRQWITPVYVNAIMDKRPQVVVIYGANAIVGSPKNASKNSKLVAQSYSDTKTFMAKCRMRAKQLKVKSPKFVLVSTIKAPGYFAKSKPTKRGCVVWDRFDAYNTKLKKYAKAHSDTIYCNIEKYYYKKVGTNKLRFFANTAGKGKTVSVSTILKNNNTCSFFAADGIHPTTQAYQAIWNRIGNAAAKVMR